MFLLKRFPIHLSLKVVEWKYEVGLPVYREFSASAIGIFRRVQCPVATRGRPYSILPLPPFTFIGHL
jgi:hypothetical protein